MNDRTRKILQILQFAFFDKMLHNKNGKRRFMYMLNSIVLVGKIETLPVMKETSGGYKMATLGLLLDRPFKNMSGEYEVDHVSVTLWRGIAEMVCDISANGDVVGVKGRVQSNTYLAKDGNTYHHLEIIAEKVSFLNKAERM